MKLSDIDLLKIGNTINMAGAVFVGEGKMYLCLFPEDGGELFDDVGRSDVVFRTKSRETFDVETLDMDADDWQKFLRQTDLMETEVLQKASDGTLAKVILRKSQRQIDAGVQWRVFKKASYSCEYCGKDDLPLTVDHLVTWEEGGPTTEENLAAACKKCNKVRGNLPFDQWLKHPRYLDLSKGLTPEVRARNEARVGTLDKIPRHTNIRSR